MKIARWAVVGFILQAALLIAFVYASRLNEVMFGKPAVMAFAVGSMGLLLWRAARVTSRLELIAICATLAVGYMAAFHVVGFLLFPGLLKDLDGLSWAYARSIIAVVGAVFAVYAVTSMVMFWFQAIRIQKDKGLGLR
jgi:hypothetical protein